MIESMRLRWADAGPMAVNPLLSDHPAVDLDRRLLPRGITDASPADNLTADDALTNSAWYRAVTTVASIVSRTPFEIKTLSKSEKGVKKAPAIDHEAYYATAHQSNPEETASECRFRATSNAVMHGAGYVGIWRTAPGGIRLYPFETKEIRKLRIDGALWYLRDLDPSKDEGDIDRWGKIAHGDMIEVSGLKKRGLLAFCTWWLARNAIAEGSEASRMRAARAKNGGRPNVVLSTEQTLQEQTVKRIQQDFARVHSGFEGTGVPAVFDRGVKATTLPYAPEFQAEESLTKIPLREIANFTGVPAVFLGDPDGISYESLEKMLEVLFRLGIEPYWHSWEDQCRAKLISPEERRIGTHTAEFDRSAMVYMDGATMGQLIRAWGGGTSIDTVNGIRARLGWEPLDDPKADELQIPKNVGQDGSNNTPTDGSKPPGGRPRQEMETVEIVSLKVPENSFSDEQKTLRVMANAWDDTVRRTLKAAERSASNDRAFMQFCDAMDADADMLKLAWERSRAAGSVYGLNVLEEHAAAGLRACKDRLLEVAGAAKKGELHTVYHAAYGTLMVTLPELAADAVLEAVSCSKTF